MGTLTKLNQDQEEGGKACDKDRSKCVHHLLEIFTHSTNSVNQTIQECASSSCYVAGWMNHTQQSSQLVSAECTVLVFLFVLTDAISLTLNLQKKAIIEISFFNCLHFCPTFLHHISKFWQHILHFWSVLIFGPTAYVYISLTTAFKTLKL